MTPPAPEKQHQWLKQMIGNWTFDSECSMGPDQPPMRTSGKESVRALGDLWVIAQSDTQTPDGQTCQNIITLGYDPAKSKFVGSFVSAMMPMIWIYEGDIDSGNRMITLTAQGPSFTDPGKMTDYHDIFEIVDADHRLLRSECKMDTGEWVPFMKALYTRAK